MSVTGLRASMTRERHGEKSSVVEEIMVGSVLAEGVQEREIMDAEAAMRCTSPD